MNEFKNIMRCEKCGLEQNFVHDSRMVGGIRYRRKICNSCGYRMTTYEISKEDLERLTGKKMK